MTTKCFAPIFLLTGLVVGAAEPQSGKFDVHVPIGPMRPGTIKCSYDISNATMTVKPLKQSIQYLIHIPSVEPLSKGTFLVHFVYRKPNHRNFDTTLYATFGKNAKLGGDVPLKLVGTGSLFRDDTTRKDSKDAKVSVYPNYLVVEVSTKQLEDRELVFAELFGTDNPPKPEPNCGTGWNLLPSKDLFKKDLGPGNYFFGSIPVVPAPKK